MFEILFGLFSSTLPAFIIFFYFFILKKKVNLGNNPEMSYDNINEW